jgi:hypothetical protein
MRRWAQKLAVVLATGYILFFYSERMFWSFLRPGDKPADFLLTWIVYSIMAWVFLLVIRKWRIASFLPAHDVAADDGNRCLHSGRLVGPESAHQLGALRRYDAVGLRVLFRPPLAGCSWHAAGTI